MTYHIVITLDYWTKTTQWKLIIIRRSRVYCCKSSYTHQTNQKKPSLIKKIFMKPTNNLLFIASTVKFGHRANNCLLESACENCGKPSQNNLCRDTSNCVNCQGNHRSSANTCPTFINLSKNIAFSYIKIMKILQLNINISSDFCSHNQFKFYQEQNNYDLMALQETNIKDKLEMFNNWKRKFHSTFTEKSFY